MSENEEKQKKTLVIKRGQVKTAVTRFKTFFDALTENHNIEEVEIRFSKFQESWGEFNDIQGQLELLDDTVVPDENLKAREEFEDRYFKLHSDAVTYIKRAKQRSDENPCQNNQHLERNSSSAATNIPVRLPTINLPTFNGNYEDWMPFFDAFQSLIHDNDQLTDMQRLQYLKGSLKGVAADTLLNLEMTAANYNVALELLKGQFQNPRLIIQQHIKALCDLPQTQRDNPSSLRKIVNSTLTHMRALNALNVDTTNWDLIVIHFITSRLDTTTHKEWELTTLPNELPKLNQLTDFLQKRCLVLENVQKTHVNHQSSHNEKSIKTEKQSKFYKSQPHQRFKTHMSIQSVLCPICKGNHKIYNCQDLIDSTIENRKIKLQNANICQNCLGYNHSLRQCKSKGCKKCGKPHHTVLHIQFSGNINYQKPNNQAHEEAHNYKGDLSNDSKPKVSTSLTSINSSDKSRTEVLLSTALVDIATPDGRKLTCRAFLDNGSQSNFITEDLCQKLKLKKERTAVSVTGVSQSCTNVTHKVGATIKSKTSQYEANGEFLVLQKITSFLPNTKVNTATWTIPKTVALADPTFAEPGHIDILLGQEFFLDILQSGKIEENNTPILQNTALGWIIGGRAPSKTKPTAINCHLSITDRLDKQLEEFWKIEEPTTKIHRTSEDELCEKLYNETVRRTEEGRYVVTMPFKQRPDVLGSSKVIATRRFIQVERRFKRQPDLHGQYSQFLEEYKDLGHMSPIQPNTNNSDLHSTEYYMPHHPVIKETSTTTKLRVVFDASCKTSTDMSLNDILLVGPTIQDDLFSIIMRFRIHPLVMTADIEKMYRQIWVDPSQRELLKIVWREHPTDDLRSYHLNTVTYGTACAPYLAVRTLHQLALDEGHHFPEAAQVLLKDFYVDDLICGADTLDEALKLQKQLIGILRTAGFNLRKWNTNNDKLLENLPSEMRERNPKELPTTTSSTRKALGLIWDAADDKLLFSYKEAEDRSMTVLSKRTILSTIAKLFDPLGLVSPIIIKAKILLQELWQEKMDWDDELPTKFRSSWSEVQQSLASLNTLKIARLVTQQRSGGTIEIHGFSDASQRAYGAAVYVRHIIDDNNIKSKLLCSKSRVAPIKTVSIPRLELCGALLLAELVNHVVKALNKEINHIYYWTDSTIVLCWLASEAATWKTFVANRVAKIHDLSKSKSWGHVNSEDNPADFVSRGVTASDLTLSELWWSGPKWLSEVQTKWPANWQRATSDQHNSNMPEKKTGSVTAASVTSETQNELSSFIKRFSSLTKLQRATAYLSRFVQNCKFPHDRKRGPLSAEELTSALQLLIKIEQKRLFSKDILKLSQSGHVSKTSKIVTLKPFIDQYGLIRVGGRLNYSQLNQDQKHPILLPDKSHLTELIATQEHSRSLHSGPQLLLSVLRQRFWPLSGRNITRKIVHKCVTCFKVKPKWNQPEMGSLPSSRITPSQTFTNVGLDYCGPIYTRSGRNRKSSLVKSYIAVFVCFATKAIHLELVSDLTTEAFMAGFKRFISRRGICQNVYSDNGTTFVGAQNELKELYKLLQDREHQERIKNASSAQNIKWHFIPAKSPHFGGLWEAGVKSVKHHLKRVAGNTNMTFEELYTTLTLIEACLNSRPLTVLSSDPNDPSTLTPGHFLIGRSLLSIPEPDFTATPTNRLSHWQRAQQLMQHFWQRWSVEYLANLQQRPKWTAQTPNIQPGQVVLIRDDNLPPLKWSTAVVQEVHPGADGRIRVATVKTSAGFFKRPTNRLCVLPID